LVESRPNAGVWVCATSNAWLLRGAEQVPFSLCLEMLAQGALELLQQGPDGNADEERRGLLAGIDDAELVAPVTPGDRLEISVTLVGRFGPLIKALGEIRDGAETRVRATLMLAQG
jgi:3-hydroxymyristoyl/3-hydroxydecanoyl-(acyl carrier protein) dehydratase